MRLQRFFVFLAIITAISLLYVQMQVEIVKLAYEGGAKEVQLKELLDTRSILVYNIDKLESVNNLGRQILASNTDLQFTDREQVASLKVPVRLTRVESNPVRKSNFLVNLFSLKAQAEATEKIK